jgi:hypothetical protein
VGGFEGAHSRPAVILQGQFLVGADADLQELFNRFEEYREGFGTELLTMFEVYLARIAMFPQIAPVYRENIRRQIMQTFPYGIFYEPTSTRILVIALLDLRQDEREIFRRLRS